MVQVCIHFFEQSYRYMYMYCIRKCSDKWNVMFVYTCYMYMYMCRFTYMYIIWTKNCIITLGVQISEDVHTLYMYMYYNAYNYHAWQLVVSSLASHTNFPKRKIKYGYLAYWNVHTCTCNHHNVHDNDRWFLTHVNKHSNLTVVVRASHKHTYCPFLVLTELYVSKSNRSLPYSLHNFAFSSCL